VSRIASILAARRSEAAIAVIACDESGNEGEQVMKAFHPVFAHAAVAVPLDEAQLIMTEVRKRLKTQAAELKSKQLLQPRSRRTTWWLFGSDGPLIGRATTYLVEKAYFGPSKVIDELYEEWTHDHGIELHVNMIARDIARKFYRLGPRAFARADWNRLLESFNSLVRVNHRKGTQTTVDEFFDLLDKLRCKCRRRWVEKVMGILVECREHAEFLIDHFDDPEALPAMDPFFAALAGTMMHWYEITGLPVRVIHDVQSTLTPPRLASMIDTLQSIHEFSYNAQPIKIEGFEFTDSRSDARVQLADLLAGASRSVASDVWLGKPLDGLAPSIFAPFIVPSSLWADEVSWNKLTP
jgi:hypothetical protein